MRYVEGYLKAYSNGCEAKTRLYVYFHYCNTQLPHQALDYRTPAEAFNGDTLPPDEQSILAKTTDLKR